eukprot:TRINITY_DN75454_c0_g1_i1.p1 TRINITY_DN75454_c0_g1~~TRINITY_DN75454_c0_g1_i1.p1  ORF type:complete len:818 (-),score=84.54 TRINITY_DN75454_c0_g1_i1:67-2520(-)
MWSARICRVGHGGSLGWRTALTSRVAPTLVKQGQLGGARLGVVLGFVGGGTTVLVSAAALHFRGSAVCVQCEEGSSLLAADSGSKGGASAAAATLLTAVAYGVRSDGSYGPMTVEENDRQRQEAEKLQAGGDAGALPTFTLEEFKKHASEESLWVAYGGGVYDVTGFVAEHPGGKEALLSAGGQDLDAFWKMYQVHFRKDAISALAPYRIGNLSDADMDILRDSANQDNAVAARTTRGKSAFMPSVERSAVRARKRALKVWLLSATAPVWWCIRGILSLVGKLPWLGPSVVDRLCLFLPCSVPGFGGAARLTPVNAATGEQARVAVIGGGIAGCSCAYSLAKSGYHVTIYESRSQLGGNAQTATFALGSGKIPVTQDLSVLYWAPEYYRNYAAMLSALQLEPAKVQLPYVIHKVVDGRSEFYTQPGSASGLDKVLQPSLEARFTDDFRRYDRMIRVVTQWNHFFSWGSSRPTFYGSNQYSILPFANPFNFIGMRSCARLFGLSGDFFETVLRPFHGLNLTTVHIDSLPSSGYQILDDIAPLHKSRWVCTWDEGNSREVFARATEASEVLLDARVRQVQFLPPSGCCDWRQRVLDDSGVTREFDRVVFACPASAVDNVVRPTSFLERTLLRGVGYHDEFHEQDWKDWLEAQVHQDPSCLPEQHRSAILEHAAFLIDVDDSGRHGSGGVERNVEYTHNLGAFSPAARVSGVSAGERTMFMTQCQHAGREIDSERTVSNFSAPRSHPNLSYTNLVVTQMLHLVQGRRGAWYCSNWTAPGNGHDLACSSGIAVASAIGASYPFPNPDAWQDNKDCRRFMCI